MTQLINPRQFTNITGLLRSFFLAKGFLEVHTQNRLSILAACEDPTTVSTYNYSGQVWPLPQTGQMWLEYELLHDPASPGFFCVSTSYRQEPNPIDGRHDLIFPMFEFEFPGTFADLKQMEMELVEHLGYTKTQNIVVNNYLDWAKQYKVEELTHEHEGLMCENNQICMITNFPNNTSPFWNMARHEGDTHAKKVDVIIHGIETIGSAQRSCDKEQMRKMFNGISNGEYANMLFSQFSRERVINEMNDFLSKEFFPRFGGGIGMTRMIRALKMSNLI